MSKFVEFELLHVNVKLREVDPYVTEGAVQLVATTLENVPDMLPAVKKLNVCDEYDPDEGVILKVPSNAAVPLIINLSVLPEVSTSMFNVLEPPWV